MTAMPIFWSFTAPPRCRTATRDLLARTLGRSPSSVHLHEGHVGGGFGIRGELYPEDVLVCACRAAPRPPGQVDRRPARASDGRQPLAPAASSDPRRGGCGWPDPRDRRRVLPRPGRLYPHARDAGGGYDGRNAARALPRAGLSRSRPFPADQQDAGRHLSGAGALRGHFRARTGARCDRRPARTRSGGGAPPQPDLPARRCPTSGRSTRSAIKSSTTRATTRPCSTRRWLRSIGMCCKPRCAAAAPRERRSASGWRFSSRRAGSVPPMASAFRSTATAPSRSSPEAPRSAKGSRR